MEPRPAYLKRTTSFGLECCKPVCLFSEGLKAFRPGLSGDGLSIEVVSHPHPAGHCGGTVVEVVHGWSFGDVAETDRAYDEGEVDRLSWLENGVRGFDAEIRRRCTVRHRPIDKLVRTTFQISNYAVVASLLLLFPISQLRHTLSPCQKEGLKSRSSHLAPSFFAVDNRHTCNNSSCWRLVQLRHQES